MKKKYSKLTLLDYFDGELSEQDSAVIKDYLLEGRKSSAFLEEIAIIENHLTDLPEITLSEEKNKKIQNQVLDLLSKRSERFAIKKEKAIINKVKKIKPIETFKGLSFEFQFGYAALTILIMSAITLGQGDVIQKRYFEIDLTPTVYTHGTDEEMQVTNDLGDEI